MKVLCSLLASLVALTVLSGAEIPFDVQTFKRVVVFLYDKSSPQPAGWKVATGFLVFIPNVNDPKHGHAVLVTARHVVDPEWTGCTAPNEHNPRKLEMRLNVKEFDSKTDVIGTAYEVVHLENDNHRLWSAHDRDDIDIAVIPLNNDTMPPIGNKKFSRIFDENDVLAMPIADFVTPADLKSVDIGNSIITAGLVPELAMAKRNYPTFRFGRVSNIFDDPLQVPCRLPFHPSKSMAVWSVSSNFEGGNSGSPIFLFPIDNLSSPSTMVLGGQPTGFLGVVSGTVQGADFSTFTPAPYVLEVIQKAAREGHWVNADIPTVKYDTK